MLARTNDGVDIAVPTTVSNADYTQWKCVVRDAGRKSVVSNRRSRKLAPLVRPRLGILSAIAIYANNPAETPPLPLLIRSVSPSGFPDRRL